MKLERDYYVEFYFSLGFHYLEILAVLACTHGIIVSERTLHRILRSRGLRRRCPKNSLLDVAIFIEEQLLTSGRLHGYRWMHTTCIQSGFNITREDVRLLLLILDSDGVRSRAKRVLRRREYFACGPNYIWHMDGYDKLKPYGLCVHGCIDGFSRRIIWLRVGRTNNDPTVIAGYFINAASEVGGVPHKMRADRGTENGIVAILHEFLNEDGSFIYGRSTANQRIESWWGILRKHSAQYWMDTLCQLKVHGHYSGDDLDKAAIQFCFTKLLQDDLDNFVDVWNMHSIRRYRNRPGVPVGRPHLMYTLPQAYGTHDYKHTVQTHVIDACKEECSFHHDTCQTDFEELFSLLLVENGWELPTTVNEGLTLYVRLRDLAKRLVYD